MLYHEILNNKLIIFYHIKNKSLPIDGWIHNCFICETYSSKLEKYNNNDKINCIVCKDCKKEFVNKKHAEIESYIKDLNLDIYI